MEKFFVLISTPSAEMADWMAKTDEATRKEQTDKLMMDWGAWMTTHSTDILDKGMPLGKTKRVTAEGVTDTKNDLNWYMVIQAESHDAAAQLFVTHPHMVMIPGSYAEIMHISNPGM